MAEIQKEDLKLLKKLGSSLVQATEQSKTLSSQINAMKDQMLEKLGELELKSFSVKDETSAGCVKTISVNEKMTIEYDIPMMKEKLGKEMYNEVAIKVVTITDLDAFIKIMKEYDVPFSEVKHLLQIHEEVSNARVNQLYQTGEIDLKKIKKCYKATFKNYISIR